MNEEIFVCTIYHDKLNRAYDSKQQTDPCVASSVSKLFVDLIRILRESSHMVCEPINIIN